jgi:uncharacterized protein YfdQ (DUF2303 family)
MSNTETSAGAELGAALAGPQNIGNTPFVLAPPNYAIKDLEAMLPAPTRSRGTTTLRDVASFIELVKQEKTDQTRIYGCYEPANFLAVFNDNFMDATGWRDHKASFSCPLSVEWKTWMGKNNVKLSQADFAQFIEDNLPDVASPPAAEMLEISRTLEAKKGVNFASGIRLSNGQNELTYEETISGTAGKGKFKIPESFTIGIPVLESGDRYSVECRLRYRIADGGKMQMWFDMLRPHKIVEDAIKQVWATIEEGTGQQIFNGSI